MGEYPSPELVAALVVGFALAMLVFRGVVSAVVSRRGGRR